jgi:cytochrome c peroxidase
LNPLEQNLPRAASVVRIVARAPYADLFEEVWGEGILDPEGDVQGAYEKIGRAIAAYERSIEVNPFSSKFDYYLKGEAELTPLERQGLELFEGKGECAECHPSRPSPNGEPPVFTDFSYDNLGTPKNPHNPFYKMPTMFNPDGADWVDPGLGGFLKTAGRPPEVYEPEWGKVKVPTLRNVDMRPYEDCVRAYMHNGVFKTLKEVVHFYNTRDVEEWPAPEVAQNVNTEELGDLGLTDQEEDAIVAFMKILTDGWTPRAKK